MNYLIKLLTAGVNPATDLFAQVEIVIDAFIGVLTSVFSGIGALLWVSGTGLTFLGMLTTIAFGVGIVYFGFRLVMRLFRPRG